ncbi:MAG: hypothetical protein HFI71_07465 [Lachnospiraceae bacterium]|jgi:hypothetical protein|nr:hypothetical protein [Lachnospiraceae bacterium]
MKNQSLSANVMKISIENSIHKVMDIIEKEDGRTFVEKKKEAIRYLKDKENTLLAERLIDIASDDEMGKRFIRSFGRLGSVLLQKVILYCRKYRIRIKIYLLNCKKKIILLSQC